MTIANILKQPNRVRLWVNRNNIALPVITVNIQENIILIDSEPKKIYYTMYKMLSKPTNSNIIIVYTKPKEKIGFMVDWRIV